MIYCWIVYITVIGDRKYIFMRMQAILFIQTKIKGMMKSLIEKTSERMKNILKYKYANIQIVSIPIQLQSMGNCSIIKSNTLKNYIIGEHVIQNNYLTIQFNDIK